MCTFKNDHCIHIELLHVSLCLRPFELAMLPCTIYLDDALFLHSERPSSTGCIYHKGFHEGRKVAGASSPLTGITCKRT